MLRIFACGSELSTMRGSTEIPMRAAVQPAPFARRAA
jgi:hypothetical protein